MAFPYTTATCLCGPTHQPHLPYLPPPSLCSGRSGTVTLVPRARKGLSSRTRRLENRGRKGGLSTTRPEEGGGEGGTGGGGEEDGAGVDAGMATAVELSTTPMPVLPPDEKDFWEGPQWDGFGFVVQYLWAFGVLFALIACGVAVATYNEGATDFKKTPIYKESIQSQDLLEEPDASSSDVFEGNPTEVAPSVE